MPHLGSSRCIAAVETMSIFAAGQRITSMERALSVYSGGLLRCGFVE
jgi:hypothetical protein